VAHGLKYRQSPRPTGATAHLFANAGLLARLGLVESQSTTPHVGHSISLQHYLKTARRPPFIIARSLHIFKQEASPPRPFSIFLPTSILLPASVRYKHSLPATKLRRHAIRSHPAVRLRIGRI
jgi:hypothetical protein